MTTTNKPVANRFPTLAAAAALALSAAIPAFAGTSTVHFAGEDGTAGVGSFTGTATYDDATDVLTLIIQNTTTAAGGASITGVAFDVSGATAAYMDGDDAATRRRDEDAFDDARGKSKKPKLVKAKPLGNYEAGAALNGKFAKKAKPGRGGAAAGASQTFAFHVTGPDAEGLTAADFFSGSSPLIVSFGGFGRRAKGVDLVSSQLVDTAVGPSSNDPAPTGGDIDRPQSPGIVVVPPHTTGDNPTPFFPPPQINDGTTEPGGGNNVDPGNGAGQGPVAVPLPPAVWTALTTFGATGFVGAARRRLKAWRGA